LCACSGGGTSGSGTGGASSGAGGVGASDGNASGVGGSVNSQGGTFGTGGVTGGMAGNGASQSTGGAPQSSGGVAAAGGTPAATAGASVNAGTAGSSGSPADGGSGGVVNGGASSGGKTGGSAGSGAQGGVGGTSANPTEKALAKLPAARQEHSVVAAAGKVYVIGGYVGSVTATVVAYDPTKNSWSEVKSFPAPMNHGNAGAVGDVIYVAGFYINNTMSKATTQTFAYDLARDEWTEKSAMPMGTERAAGCVAVDAGFMYVIGGARDGKSVSYAARYDAAGDKWEALPDLPDRREHCAAGMIGGTLYVAGGRADGITGIEPLAWSYNPTAKSWKEITPLESPRGGLAGAVLRGRLFVFGGEGNSAVSSGVFPNVDAYDPATNSWEALPAMLIPRHGFGAATLGDRIYLPGGATKQGAGATDAVSVFY
jgi:hypothetical protein